MVTLPCFWSSNSIFTRASLLMAANLVLASWRHLSTSLPHDITTFNTKSQRKIKHSFFVLVHEGESERPQNRAHSSATHLAFSIFAIRLGQEGILSSTEKERVENKTLGAKLPCPTMFLIKKFHFHEGIRPHFRKSDPGVLSAS